MFYYEKINRDCDLYKGDLTNKSFLEKIVKNSSDLRYLLSNSNIIKNAVSIIEPSDHVGENNDGEGVRESSNIAYICRMVAD